jgi:hypothetical protein
MTPPEAGQEVAAAHTIERDRTHLNEHEQTLLKQLLAPGAIIEAVIPADAPAEELWTTLDACVRGYRILDARSTRLRLIIGKLLIIFENKPSLYKTLGYDTFFDFMRKGAYDTLGIHRSSAYEGKRAAKNWPQLSPDRYASIGVKNIELLNKFTNGKSPHAEEWLDRAEKMKTRELQKYVEERGFLNNGEAAGATFTIPTNRDRYARFKEFFEDGRVQSYCGSKYPDAILEHLIEECHDEWICKSLEGRMNGK